MENKKLQGHKWKNIKADIQEKLLLRANTIDGITGNLCKDGECIVVLNEYLSIAGKIIDGEIVIDEESRIYNSEEGSYITPQQRWEATVGLCSKSYKLNRILTEDFADACENIGVPASVQLTKMMKDFIFSTRIN